MEARKIPAQFTTDFARSEVTPIFTIFDRLTTILSGKDSVSFRRTALPAEGRVLEQVLYLVYPLTGTLTTIGDFDNFFSNVLDGIIYTSRQSAKPATYHEERKNSFVLPFAYCDEQTEAPFLSKDSLYREFPETQFLRRGIIRVYPNNLVVEDIIGYLKNRRMNVERVYPGMERLITRRYIS